MKWISVKERLPENKQSVLFYIDNLEFSEDDRIAKGYYDYGQFYDEYTFEEWGLETSHWMPLPEPPEK